MQKVIMSKDSYKYCEVYQITERRDGCIYKTASLGYISVDKKKEYDTRKYGFTSISTQKTAGMFANLDPFLYNGGNI